MHPRVFDEFDQICRDRRAGGDVLEIGAVPSEESLLHLPALAGVRSKVGISLEAPARFADFDIVTANANDLGCFADSSFDTVLSNSVLEHDPFFWRTLAEIRRVSRPGAIVAIGVPGFLKLAAERWMRRVSRGLFGQWAAGLAASTLTLQVHRFPGDHYRFSPQAVREVFLEGLQETEVRTLLIPPRIIGVGVKP